MASRRLLLTCALTLLSVACSDRAEPGSQSLGFEPQMALMEGQTLGPTTITTPGDYRWGMSLSEPAGFYYWEIIGPNGRKSTGSVNHPGGILQVWGAYWPISGTTADFQVKTRLYDQWLNWITFTPTLNVDVAIPYSNPVVGSVATNPSPAEQYTPFTVTVYGNGFDPATAEIWIYGPNGTNCCAYIRNNTLTTKNYNQLTGSIQLSITGTYTVRVKNVSSGVLSNASNTFVVEPY